MERYDRALNKIRELEERLQRETNARVVLSLELDEALRQLNGQTNAKLIEFVQLIADSSSKFAKDARKLLGQ